MQNPIAAVIAAAVTFAAQSAALAQSATSSHTYFGITGQNVTSCGEYNAPCSTFSYAYARTKPGGTMQCLDSRLPETTTISKSLTYICDRAPSSNSGTVATFILMINIGPTDTVTLVGLKILGSDTAFGYSVPGIDFTGSGALILEKVVVTGWYSGGVLFQPNGAGRLVIDESLFVRNGGGGVGAAIRVVPQGSGTAQVSINNSRVSANVFGLAVDGSNSSGGINATIRDSVMSANSQDGIIATSNAAPVGVNVLNSASLNNGYGIRSIGSNVTVRVEGSKMIGNGTGVSGGGALLTGGGNTVQGNATNGAFTGSYAQQ